MLELTDYYGEQFPKVFQACEREYLALSEDERKTYDWSIQCHKFRTNTCYREIPAHWDSAGKLVPEHETSESRPHRPRSLLKPLTEYHFSAPICVELHKVLTRMVLAFGGGLSARALLITLLLDSEAAFDIDHPVEGPMRLDEIVLPSTSGAFFVTVPCWSALTTTENSSPSTCSRELLPLGLPLNWAPSSARSCPCG
ncbi:hypothetical protein PAPYR_12098 [Paratrimastix pyriformis]|uniref:Uncharacterized protein n=1 Tax=Paratrimastix pyriformis TaxID=342808 RepID=A0ABQ8U9C0_9EUKA|nr:hypothetical protein PAPYR_12098 [Paratrimastix pyriformis]